MDLEVVFTKGISDETVRELVNEIERLEHGKRVGIEVAHMMQTEEQAHRMLQYLQSENPKSVQLIYEKIEEIWGRVDFSKRSETIEYWNRILPILADKKIKAIFLLSAPGWRDYDEHRIYEADTEVYILFEDDMSLVIDYMLIDCLKMSYRPLSEREKIQYREAEFEDIFNSVDDIYNAPGGVVIRVETIALEYDAIAQVTVNTKTKEFEKWVGNDLVFVKPTKETFYRLDIHMKNGNVISICPGSAETNGGCEIWSEDTVETFEIK